MCGIVGYIGEKNCPFLLLDALKRLEYRGYDSAGIAIIDNGKISSRRVQGKLNGLDTLLREKPLKGTVGIGHTRWATHGVPSENNAHPHIAGPIAVVHNGIIENYLSLRKELEKKGIRFSSQTDTEVIAQLIALYFKKDIPFEEAVKLAIKRLKGSFALAILCAREPDKIIGVRKESPLIIGLGEGENFLASDAPALLPYTKRVIFMNDEEMAILQQDKIELKSFSGKLLSPKSMELPWTPSMAEKAGYKHFMQKEIFEQPRAIADTVRSHMDLRRGKAFFEEFQLNYNKLKKIKKIWIVACGTSFHAGLVGKYMIERLCRLPVEVDIASEFRYREPIIDKNMLLILISQSGETADTLAALKEGKKRGAKVLGICNVLGSTLSRECDYVIHTHAGPEIGVASTKAFTTQISILYLLALYLACMLNHLDTKMAKSYLNDMLSIPHQVESLLKKANAIETLASYYGRFHNFLYLGRGIYFPIAMEGALKLKEISYIHAEAYAAGEMKHGPIALIDENMPVVVLAPKGGTYAKVLSNMEEVRSRRGKIIALTEKDCKEVKEKADEVIYIPSSNPFLKTILLTIPLQLLAYYIAVFRGTDVDQPRNLAKSVTVE
ncbi:MAG TPA: glutamine--fructose-6-phosphate transaminase (isomerizing) [Candidatus Desulfofervidus auxilii]|uniref:Glutamine--fructose-6-phosphate aminotransferase [isomerizing] n=1 Tax=Desulfofervidus auxilii TaxID=1621989 RepID=A0A7V0I9M4_DESA2|nr:glutamine--fructose-6-phosphate transaminase (isomerizing) [Candidatus Desulfofervidus auxilii]